MELDRSASLGHSAPRQLDIELLRRFDVSGPRYTSYPTADRFIEAFDGNTLESWLKARTLSQQTAPISAYVHLPYCESLCHYCACNKIITRDHSKAATYLVDLAREIAMYHDIIGTRLPISNLHLGGGSPTFLSDDELAHLMDLLGGAFTWAPNAERSIEIDPRTVNRHRVKALAALGFNRASFGVQDFDPKVQAAVNRVQSTEQIFEMVGAAREFGFSSINVDMIYGLPHQTPASFEVTLRTLRDLRPDRIALYAYAHLPTRFKPQRRIQQNDLPLADAKVSMIERAVECLLEDGYVYIGMDHFALPNDGLAIAKSQGRLHRNFQGYTAQPDGDLIGLGVSAISKIGPTYSQNLKTVAEYRDSLAQGRLPVSKGIELSADDVMRRAVIMALMCQGRVSIEAMEIAHLVDFQKAFASELKALREFEKQGLVDMTDEWIQVTDRGWYVVRAIAMVFDRYLHTDAERAKFSRIL